MSRSNLDIKAALCVALTIFVVAKSNAAPEQGPASSAQSENADARSFLTRLKTIVDEEELFEPDKVAKTLGATVRGHTDKDFPARNCSGLYGDRSFVAKTYDIENSWFKPGPEGVQRMKVPSFFINPAGEVGNPSIKYDICLGTYCHGEEKIHSSSAVLSFGGLSSFSCLTPEVLKKFLGIDTHEATDGVSVAHYFGRENDRYGTDLTFYFRAFAPCAVGADIRQEEERGNRQRRAFQKYRVCVDRANHEFCVKHPDLNPGEADRLVDDANKVCGTLLSFISKEPWTGESPPPLPETPNYGYSAGPCAGK
jgi:hypothetical protein